MNEQETAAYYAHRQAYFEKCEAFKERLKQYFEHYKPKHKTYTT